MSGHFSTEPPTPPAHVRRLEERVRDQEKEIRELRSKYGADILALQHQLGWIAGWVLAIGRKVGVDESSVRPVEFAQSAVPAVAVEPR